MLHQQRPLERIMVLKDLFQQERRIGHLQEYGFDLMHASLDFLTHLFLLANLMQSPSYVSDRGMVVDWDFLFGDYEAQ